MQRISQLTIAALAALGMAFAGTALAQKAETPKDAKKTEAPAKKADAKKTDAKAVALIDINTASEKELASLKGIGDVRARAIVKGRPYKGKNDLVDRKIVPQGVYDDIREQIIAKQDTAGAAKKDEKKK